MEARCIAVRHDIIYPHLKIARFDLKANSERIFIYFLNNAIFSLELFYHLKPYYTHRYTIKT